MDKQPQESPYVHKSFSNALWAPLMRTDYSCKKLQKESKTISTESQVRLLYFKIFCCMVQYKLKKATEFYNTTASDKTFFNIYMAVGQDETVKNLEKSLSPILSKCWPLLRSKKLKKSLDTLFNKSPDEIFNSNIHEIDQSDMQLAIKKPLEWVIKNENQQLNKLYNILFPNGHLGS